MRRASAGNLPTAEEVERSGIMLEEPTVEKKKKGPTDFRITKGLQEKFGSTIGCAGCEHAGGGRHTNHSDVCRRRFEEAMREDVKFQERLTSREIRREAHKIEEAEERRMKVDESPKVEGSSSSNQDQPVEPNLFRDGEKGSVEARHERRVTQTRPRGQGGDDEEDARIKRRRISQIVRGERKMDTAYERFMFEDRITVMENVINMIESNCKTMDAIGKVNRLVQTLMEDSRTSPHESEQAMDELYSELDFVDDVKKLEPLDRKRVIKARMEEIKFFKKMGVYRKVSRAEVLARGGKIISTKWVDTNKGCTSEPNCRCRLVGQEFKRDKRLDLYVATHPLESI